MANFITNFETLLGAKMFAPTKLFRLPLFKHLMYIKFNPKLCNFAWCQKVALATLSRLSFSTLCAFLFLLSPLFKTLQWKFNELLNHWNLIIANLEFRQKNVHCFWRQNVCPIVYNNFVWNEGCATTFSWITKQNNKRKCNVTFYTVFPLH